DLPVTPRSGLPSCNSIFSIPELCRRRDRRDMSQQPRATACVGTTRSTQSFPTVSAFRWQTFYLKLRPPSRLRSGRWTRFLRHDALRRAFLIKVPADWRRERRIPGEVTSRTGMDENIP